MKFSLLITLLFVLLTSSNSVRNLGTRLTHETSFGLFLQKIDSELIFYANIRQTEEHPHFSDHLYFIVPAV